MENPQSNITELFKKFLEGSCTAAELQSLLNYFCMEEVDAELKSLVIRELGIDEREDINLHSRVDKIVNETDKVINSIRTSDLKLNAITHWMLNWRWFSGAAAIFILIFGLYFAKIGFFSDDRMIYTEVPITKVESIILADGSQVTLNAGSILRYPNKFKGKSREVYLEGEGEFKVTRDVTRPFIVHAGNLRTKVLGTSFIIKAYRGNEKIQVTVISGKVNVLETRSRRNVNLLHDEQVVYTKKTETFSKLRVVDAYNATLWKAGKLAFDDALFGEVAEQFSRKYGQKIVFENPAIANCRISIVFNEETPNEIVKVLSILANAKFRMENGAIIFYGAGCQLDKNEK